MCYTCTWYHTHQGTHMNYELITIIVTIIATGATVLGLTLPRFSKIDDEISGLKERMARLEGLFEGFTGRAGTG